MAAAGAGVVARVVTGGPLVADMAVVDVNWSRENTAGATAGRGTSTQKAPMSAETPISVITPVRPLAHFALNRIGSSTSCLEIAAAMMARPIRRLVNGHPDIPVRSSDNKA